METVQLHIKDLSSRGIEFIPGFESDTLDVRRVGMTELAMLSEACSSNRPDLFLDAMNNCVINADLSQVPAQDFLQIAALIRTLSFPNSPITFDWKCKGANFHKDGVQISPDEAADLTTNEGLVYSTCNRRNVQTYGFKDLEVIQLNEDFVLPEGLDIPRAKHHAEYIALHSNPQVSKLLPAIQWIKEGETLEEKHRILVESENIELFDLASKTHSDNEFGMRSSLVGECSLCKTKSSVQFAISQYSFFR